MANGKPDTNPLFPLYDDMGNGASVEDWLGTASAAAQVAADNMRWVMKESQIADLSMFTSRAKLDYAQRQLNQAVEELNTIVGHIELQRIRKQQQK